MLQTVSMGDYCYSEIQKTNITTILQLLYHTPSMKKSKGLSIFLSFAKGSKKALYHFIQYFPDFNKPLVEKSKTFLENVFSPSTILRNISPDKPRIISVPSPGPAGDSIDYRLAVTE